MKNYLEKLIQRENLSLAEMKNATNCCFKEDITNSEIAAFLTALQAKGATADEIAGLVEVILDRSTFTMKNPLPNAMDNCGTGGDQSYSFNISTTSAFVLAGAGVPVAKHGNRSISSKTGSADVLEELGVSLDFTNEQVEEMLHENNIAFMFAPNVHTAFKPFSPVRQDLGLPTIFNIIGPLTNPIALDSQFLGVYDVSLLELLAESLRKLGRKRAVVINGAGSMDEASLAGENAIVLLEDGETKSITLTPEDVGLPTYSNDEIRGGDAKDNAAILLNVLKGKPGAYYDTILLNAGLGLFANGKADTIKLGIEQARQSIESGAAMKRLENLIEYSKKTSEVI